MWSIFRMFWNSSDRYGKINIFFSSLSLQQWMDCCICFYTFLWNNIFNRFFWKESIVFLKLWYSFKFCFMSEIHLKVIFFDNKTQKHDHTRMTWKMIDFDIFSGKMSNYEVLLYIKKQKLVWFLYLRPTRSAHWGNGSVFLSLRTRGLLCF